jgi:hypothetical protein
MTDYSKWDKVNFKELGVDSSSSDDDGSDEEHPQPGQQVAAKKVSEVEAYMERVKTADAAKARLAELEKEQEVLQKQMARTMEQHRRQEMYIRVGLVAIIVIGFLIQAYVFNE